MKKRIFSFFQVFLFIVITPSLSISSPLKDKGSEELSLQVVAVSPFLAKNQSTPSWFAEAVYDLLQGELFELSQANVLSKKQVVKALNSLHLGLTEPIPSNSLGRFRAITNADWLLSGNVGLNQSKFELKVKAISLKDLNKDKKFRFRGEVDSLSLTLKEATAQIAKATKVKVLKSDRKKLFKPDNFDFALLTSLYEAKKEKKQGRLKEARDVLVPIVEQHPDFVLASLELSDIYLEDFQRESAVTVLEASLKENPNSLRLLNQLGHFYSQIGENLKAKEYFEKALTLSANQENALWGLSNLLFAEQLYELSLELARRGERFASNKGDFQTLLGKIYQEKEELILALEMYKKASALDPGNIEASKRKGIVLALLGKYEEAESTYTEALGSSAQSALDQKALQHQNSLQEEAYDNHVLKEALDQVREEPKNVVALNALGTAWEQAKEWEKAEESFNKAIEINPSFQPAHFNLGAHLAQRGRVKESAASFNKSIELNPKHAASYIHLGELYVKNQEVKKGIQIWEKGFEQLPKDKDIVEKLVHVYAQMNRWKSAIETYEKLAQASGEEHASTWIGQLFLKYDKKREALRFFKKGIKEYPKNSQPYKELAVYYDFYGKDLNKAIKYYETYLNLETELDKKEAVQTRIAKLKEQIR